MFDAGMTTPLSLGLFSPLFRDIQADDIGKLEIVGFLFFDSASGATASVDPELAHFLASGPPPLIFALASLAVHSAGAFYGESLKVARATRMRAVLLTRTERRDLAGDDVIFRRDAPHSLVFPDAAAVIHHGGIGTTGQALRAGRPQLIVAHMGDRRDNGERPRRLGAGYVPGAKTYSAERAVPHLTRLLAEDAPQQRAAAFGARIRSERGAAAAAEAIMQVVER